MSCGFPAEFSDFSWLGLGPQDTYADRMEGGIHGVHSINVRSSQDLFPVIQEYGNKCNVRELSLTKEDGSGIHIICEEGLCAGVRSWSLEQLITAGKTVNLPESDQAILNLDAIQNGLNQTVILPHTTYTYRFLLEPIE